MYNKIKYKTDYYKDKSKNKFNLSLPVKKCITEC